MFDRNYRFDFFHQGFNRENHISGGVFRSEKKLLPVFVQNDDSLRMPKWPMNCDSSRDSIIFLGIYRRDSFCQGFSRKQKNLYWRILLKSLSFCSLVQNFDCSKSPKPAVYNFLSPYSNSSLKICSSFVSFINVSIENFTPVMFDLFAKSFR